MTSVSGTVAYVADTRAVAQSGQLGVVADLSVPDHLLLNERCLAYDTGLGHSEDAGPPPK